MSESPPPVRFHLSLNVSDISRGVTFFQSILGMPAAKHRKDYAKFEVDQPPLVLSLEPRSPRDHGSLNHVGFRFETTEALVEAQRRLEAAGVRTQREEGVECCYARQTKFWVHDFDQRLWEFYVLEGDIDHRGDGQAVENVMAAGEVPTDNAAVIWEHRMGSPFDFPAHLCDEIRLRGSFNVPVSSEQVRSVLQQVFETLKPGSNVELHMLTSEEALCREPSLPGPASYVKHVPVRAELLTVLEEVGFVDIQLTTFRSRACFEFDGHALRETRIVAARPRLVSESMSTVLFKGPFREVRDDEGNVWRRGETVQVPASRWESLRLSPLAEMFTEVPPQLVVGQCGT
jgi:catechol 2,3-dioxygenase-like lactoylglutathione lyase family enzyme